MHSSWLPLGDGNLLVVPSDVSSIFLESREDFVPAFLAILDPVAGAIVGHEVSPGNIFLPLFQGEDGRKVGNGVVVLSHVFLVSGFGRFVRHVYSFRLTTAL